MEYGNMQLSTRSMELSDLDKCAALFVSGN